ncbi:4-hydroxy-tetrahydrodipicolinate synthase [Pigmentibacter sp. JX0631]|uniref:4-hydroxy-tetrahydrodipicolinate synthase n=1 Tax=Pigmentibacter sp. JX0631 TaxID=2976982 RepID=UPI002468B6AC|nr:4-hydroxy-tetrahydrodipicolinate synthase [Pigmentibacter sp. JX0631]WGL60447.1 4-hydroxy-tetrahydrodipicolinate synthase [Pigmentibacter sp. JX0631]
MSHLPFSGVMTAIITPFLPTGEIDFNSFEKIILKQKKSGINGIVVLGTTGENVTLSDQESEALVLKALNYQEDSFHIYVGTGTNYTKSTIEKSIKFANILGKNRNKANGIMLVTPYYNKPSQSCLVKHYSEVSKLLKDTAICIYNVPGRTGITILPNTLAKIVEENSNIVAIKEAAGNVNSIVEMRNILNLNKKSDVRILSGDDATYAPALMCGADGVISVTSHIIPKTLLKIKDSFFNGNIKEAQKLHLSSYCINNGIFALPNPIGVKGMLAYLGECENILRAPLYPAEQHEEELLRGILKQLKQNNIPDEILL